MSVRHHENLTWPGRHIQESQILFPVQVYSQEDFHRTTAEVGRAGVLLLQTCPCLLSLLASTSRNHEGRRLQVMLQYQDG